MTKTPYARLWSTPEHAQAYLRRADSLPHRAEGEAALLEFVPHDARRVLDIGTGSGRLIALIKSERPGAKFVGLDFSRTMLEAFEKQFAADPNVSVISHDFARELPAMSEFDCVVSGFAIHHMTNERKRTLYREIFEHLAPGGAFCNLEHVASPSEALHEQFLRAIGMTREEEDLDNILLDLETQLQWLRDAGFAEVDCHWKWRELALFGGVKPRSAT